MREAKILSQEITTLLSKLYNYFSDESTRLGTLTMQKEDAEKKKAKAEGEEADLKSKVSALEKKLEKVKDEGEKLGITLGAINRDEYATVLECLNIEFNPAGLKEELDKKLPNEVMETTNEIKASKLTLKSVQGEINGASDDITKKTAEIVEERNIMAKLKEYVEIALTGNINVTREEITNLLKLFAFADHEQKELAKILMFPEDALIIYDNQQKGKPTPPPVNTKVKVEKKEKEIINAFVDISMEAEPSLMEEQMNNGGLIDLDIHNLQKPVEKAVESITSPVSLEEKKEEPQKVQELTKEEVSAFVNELIDVKQVPKKALDVLRKDFDKGIAKNNVEYTKSKGLADEIYFKNPNLLMDSELKLKIEFLMNDLAKQPEDILLNIYVLENYSKADLLGIKQRILALEIDPRQVPLYIYKMGLDNFLNNVKFFYEKGIRFDAKSISKQPFALALSSVDNTKKLYDVLGAYKMSITKQNGKNIIPLISKQAPEFVKELDAMIELGRLEQYQNNPQDMIGEVA